ncbi:MAG: regulatory protein GemA [Deltaproteobacteria bacterium]|nr:regulatory protein GemA [Deltaproteobacteria bacterium]
MTGPGMITYRQIKLIHVARRKTGMTEDEYRAMLAGFGVKSSRQLSQIRFEQVMKHFAKLGFKRSRGNGKRPAGSRERLRGKVAAILSDLRLTDAYADAIAKSRFNVDAWTWLEAGELCKLTAMLTYHQRRHPERGGQR